MNAFNMDHEQPINFSHDGDKFALTGEITNISIVSKHCEHKIGVGALYRKLSTYLPHNASDLLVNSEIVAFSYNNKTEKSEPLPKNMHSKITFVFCL